jgi:site-specific DNA-methyltransferase (adenine-specific)
MSYHDMARSTGITEWPTPQWLAGQLAAEFGPFDLDPAATAENAKAPRFYTAAVDGLSQPWHGRVFCNPPYGKVSTPAWLAKARAEVDLGHAARVVCLVPARVGTAWWRECEVDPQVFVRVIGHIRWQADQRGEAPFDSAVIVFGQLPGRHGRYPATCANPGCSLPYRRFWPRYAKTRTCSERCRKAVYRARKMSQIQAPNTGHGGAG